MPIDEEKLEKYIQNLEIKIHELDAQRDKLVTLRRLGQQHSRKLVQTKNGGTSFENPKDDFGEEISTSARQDAYDKFMSKYDELMQ